MNKAGLGLCGQDKDGEVGWGLACQAEGLGFHPKTLGSHGGCAGRTSVTCEVVFLLLLRSNPRLTLKFTAANLPCAKSLHTHFLWPACCQSLKALGGLYWLLPAAPQAQLGYALRAAPFSDASQTGGEGSQEELGYRGPGNGDRRNHRTSPPPQLPLPSPGE